MSKTIKPPLFCRLFGCKWRRIIGHGIYCQNCQAEGREI